MKTLSFFFFSLLLILSTFSGCTKPGETTGIGAATGGAIGAGLGAIVGNQTGNPGSGLAIGAAAGASAGALVGNALEAQQKTAQQQDEAVERQEALLQAQKSEIEELRRGGADFKASPRSGKYAQGDLFGDSGATNSAASTSSRRNIEKVAPGDLYLSAGTANSTKSYPQKNVEQLSPSSSEYIEAPVPSKIAKNEHHEKASLNPSEAKKSSKKISDDTAEAVVGSELSDSDTSILETDIPTTGSIPAEALDASDSTEKVAPIKLSETKPLSETVETVSAVNLTPSKECKGASAEVKKANDAKDSGDKLFHYRRALRICPNDAAIHKDLGALYASLGRKEDAVFEYQEALKANTGDEEAKAKIAELQ